MFKKTVGALAGGLMLATLAASPAAAETPAQNEALVEAWYYDFLGRDVDSGAQFWVDALNRGDSPATVLDALQNTPEFAEVTVDDIYLAFLGRQAVTDPGARGWINGVRGDMAPEWVSQNVLASPEFATEAGTNRVDEWYTIVLGRSGANPANTGEEAYWTNRIAAVGDLAALREIWYSPEGIEFRVDNLYLGFLRRDAVPSDGEVAYWYDKTARSLKDTANAFAVTSEYRTNAEAGTLAEAD